MQTSSNLQPVYSRFLKPLGLLEYHISGFPGTKALDWGSPPASRRLHRSLIRAASWGHPASWVHQRNVWFFVDCLTSKSKGQHDFTLDRYQRKNEFQVTTLRRSVTSSVASPAASPSAPPAASAATPSGRQGRWALEAEIPKTSCLDRW